MDPEDPEAAQQEYFQTWSIKQFTDILHQLKQTSDEKDKFDCLLQDLTGVMADNALRREQFHKWKPRYEKLAKTKYLTNEENPDMDDDTKFGIWLKNFCEKMPEDQMINNHWTHSDIWSLLLKAQGKNYLSAQNLGDFLHFREVAYDIFLLFDQDHDNILRKYIVHEDRRWEDGDIDNDFWDVLNETMEDNTSQGAKDWITSLEVFFNKDVDYHAFQQELWRGVIDHNLDYEEMARLSYKEIAGDKCFCFQDLRAAKMRDKLARVTKEGPVAPI